MQQNNSSLSFSAGSAAVALGAGMAAFTGSQVAIATQASAVRFEQPMRGPFIATGYQAAFDEFELVAVEAASEATIMKSERISAVSTGAALVSIAAFAAMLIFALISFAPSYREMAMNIGPILMSVAGLSAYVATTAARNGRR